MPKINFLTLLRQGVTAWNTWRTGHRELRPDLKEVDLFGADLSGADLSGKDLSGATLTRADLTRADLSGADLSGADLKGGDLSHADLRGANLTGADLRGTDLQQARIGKTTKLDAKWRLVWEIVTQGAEGRNLARTDLQGADLRDANLRGATLRDANLRRADLQGADLRDAELQGADLRDANLRDANLTGADLTKALLRDTAFTGSILSDTRFTSIEESTPYVSFLDLAAVERLDTIDFGDPNWLSNYLLQAFDYTHGLQREGSERSTHQFAKALRNIKALLGLVVSLDDPPPDLITVVHTITDELLSYLKTHPKELYKLKPRQFEELIAEILASFGWHVQLTPATRDGGYDIYAISKDVAPNTKTSWIIECKKYKPERKVGVDIVRSLYGLGLDLRVGNMLLATTSYFSRDAQKYKASRYDLELRDYEGVIEWLNAYHPNPKGRLHIKDNRLILPGRKD